MGLLDSLVSTLASGSSSGASDGADSLLPIVLKQLANYPGGIPALIQAFESGGLGEVVQSWIGTGSNMPVTGDQLASVFEPGTIQAIADESGKPHNEVLDSLAGMLPHLVDQATPNGSTDDVQGLGALSMLSRLAR